MWTKEQHDESVKHGWRLVTTFDNGDVHPLYDVVPEGEKFPNAEIATHSVIETAKRGSVLCQQALRLVVLSRQRTKPTRKKK